MAATPVVPASTSGSKTGLILEIIQLALVGLQAVPGVAVGAELGGVFLGIFQKAVAAYQAETGKPFDVTLIPIESQVP
jgi:hypothetical protein